MHQMCIVLLLICSVVPLVTVADIKLEAEDAALTGVIVQTAIKPFSGKGCVTDFDKPDDKIKFNVNIPNTNLSSPPYELKIQYNSPYGDKGFDLIVNGYATSGILTSNDNKFSLLSWTSFY
jgi:mannan endo-1,4-beta-mannosidase